MSSGWRFLGNRRTKDPINVDYRVDGSVARNKIAKIAPRCNGIRSPFIRGENCRFVERVIRLFYSSFASAEACSLWRVTARKTRNWRWKNRDEQKLLSSLYWHRQSVPFCAVDNKQFSSTIDRNPTGDAFDTFDGYKDTNLIVVKIFENTFHKVIESHSFSSKSRLREEKASRGQ